METTTCKHEEKIENGDQGIPLGTCSICHQVRRYDTRNPKEKARVIRLGRINGSIVLPGQKDIPELSTEEAAELEAAKKSPVLVHTKGNPGTTDEQSVPPPPKERHLLGKYYEENKEAILHDYQALLLREFFRKWQFHAGSWTKLKRSWGLQGKRPVKKSKAVSNPSRPASRLPAPDPLHTNDQLPPFPAFNDSWPFIVQEKWLEVYQELKKLARS